MIKNYVVEGMTSEACRAAVEEEINEIPGTQGVEVDLETGRVAVTGEGLRRRSRGRWRQPASPSRLTSPDTPCCIPPNYKLPYPRKEPHGSQELPGQGMTCGHCESR